MTNAPELLKSLGGIRAPGLGGASRAGNTGGSGGIDFAKLLSEARAGGVSSGLAVTAGKSLELSASQLERLAVLADRAEAQGAERALVLMDGQAYALDVGTRTITGKVDLKTSGVMTEFDAVLVSSEGGAEQGTVLSPPGGAVARNEQLTRLLERVSDRERSGAA